MRTNPLIGGGGESGCNARIRVLKTNTVGGGGFRVVGMGCRGQERRNYDSACIHRDFIRGVCTR